MNSYVQYSNYNLWLKFIETNIFEQIPHSYVHLLVDPNQCLYWNTVKYIVNFLIKLIHSATPNDVLDILKEIEKLIITKVIDSHKLTSQFASDVWVLILHASDNSYLDRSVNILLDLVILNHL